MKNNILYRQRSVLVIILVQKNCSKRNKILLVYSLRLAEETPLLYAKLALKDNGLQDYVNAMNELN